MIISDLRNTYFGEGTTPLESSIYSNAYTVNSSGVDVREITLDSGKNNGKTVSIAMITDSHLRIDNQVHSEALKKAMECAAFAEQIVLCGDNIESASSLENIALFQEIVWDNYPETIAVLGNHEYFYPGAGTVDDVKQNVYAAWKHDPDYYSKLVGDKVLVVAIDDARQPTYGESVYYFTEDKCDKFETDIAYAREKGYVILFFHHVALSSLDKSLEANAKMYDIVTKNADIIKGCFSGHNHIDNYATLQGSYTDADGNVVSAEIPCYWLKACAENNGRGNVLFINVE